MKAWNNSNHVHFFRDWCSATFPLNELFPQLEQGQFLSHEQAVTQKIPTRTGEDSSVMPIFINKKNNK